MKAPSSGAHPAWRKPGPRTEGWQRRQHPWREVMTEGRPAQPHPPGDGIRSLLPGTAVRAACQVRVDNLTGHAGVFTVQAGGDGLLDAVTIHASVVAARRPDSSRQSQELPGPRPPLS